MMLADRFLLEQATVALTAVNLWGTLGIVAASAFASLAHIWINEYTLSTTLAGEFAPAAATDILTLMISTPVVVAVYNAVRDHIRFRRDNGCG